MKNALLILISAALLASCAPKEEATQTSTDSTAATTTTDTGVATDATTADTGMADTTATDTGMADTTTTDTGMADTTVTDTAATTDSTLTNADNATVGEEADMAAGDGLEGKVMTFDGSAQTFGLNENDKNYDVSVTDATVYEGTATTAEEFFGADRMDADVAVEGKINGESLVASKITLN
ncbi:hypothetical protein [Deinococcus sp.]|uniref:hypothetical protein n=1 Tax=Deinococcus sp. TaxID=47478 RepID=UPI002869D0E4|nr:hypothetical protein [Deinococcus sp.]